MATLHKSVIVLWTKTQADADELVDMLHTGGAIEGNYEAYRISEKEIDSSEVRDDEDFEECVESLLD